MENVIPGTKFAEGAPPAATGQTLWRPPSPGGGREIAAGIGKIGGALAAYALNTIKQEQVMEVSEKQRKIDELGWAAHNSVVGDEEADRKLWEKFQTDANLIASSSEWEDVNNLLTKHINSVSPNWEQGIYSASLTKRREIAKDTFNLEWSSSLENDQFDKAYELLDRALSLGVITQPEYDNLKKNAPADSRLLKAERLIELNENDAALAELGELKDLTTEQLKRKNILSRTAENARDQISYELHNDILNKMAAGMSLKDMGEAIKQTAGLDGVQKTNMMKIAIGADKVWQQKSENAFNTTQDYEKLVDTWYKVKTKEITDFESLYDIFRSGPEGAPAFSLNYMQWLDNELDSMGGKRAVSKTETKYRELLWKYYTKDGKFISSQSQTAFRENNTKLTNLLKEHGGDLTRLDAEFQKLIVDVKTEKARGILSWPWWIMGTSPVLPAKLGKVGFGITKTATNPKTGERIGWNGSKWIPL